MFNHSLAISGLISQHFLSGATAACVERQAMFLFRKYDHGLGAWKRRLDHWTYQRLFEAMGCGKEGKPMGLSMDMTGSLHPRLAQHGAGFFF